MAGEGLGSGRPFPERIGATSEGEWRQVFSGRVRIMTALARILVFRAPSAEYFSFQVHFACGKVGSYVSIATLQVIGQTFLKEGRPGAHAT